MKILSALFTTIFIFLIITPNPPQMNSVFENTRLRMMSAVINGVPYVYGYDNVWARDTLFASYGFISDGEYDPVKNLLYYLWKARYTSTNEDSICVIANTTYPRQGGDSSIDSSPLWIIIADEYLKATGDQEFKEFIKEEQCYQKIERWMDGRIEDGLVSQHGIDRYYCDWSDSARKGLRPKNVMYSNILFWKAYNAINMTKANALKSNIDDKFWTGKYYRDFLGGDYLSADGNLLAIMWEFTSINQSEIILENMYDLIFPFPTITVKPDYHHDPRNYQNGRVWGWLGAITVVAYTKVGDFENANRVLMNLVNMLEKENWRFSELYTRDGYSAGAPLFVWFSGLFMYALHNLDKAVVVPIFADTSNTFYSTLSFSFLVLFALALRLRSLKKL